MSARGGGLRVWGLLAAFGVALGPVRTVRAAEARPLVAVLGVCSNLASDTYPADTQNWFDAAHNAQVIFYAQLLFPVRPLPDESLATAAPEAWHPPMALVAPVAQAGVDEGHYAEAEWLDPLGKRLALLGMTLTARAQSDWVTVSGRAYIPHTFAMAIGTRDLRAAAGQTRLPDQQGQYTVRLKIDGRSLGLAFFRMLHASAATTPVTAAAAPGPKGVPAIQAIATPVPIPALPTLQLP